jgi:hypothetical protein
MPPVARQMLQVAPLGRTSLEMLRHNRFHR